MIDFYLLINFSDAMALYTVDDLCRQAIEHIQIHALLLLVHV
jgi:hypothetical protein